MPVVISKSPFPSRSSSTLTLVSLSLTGRVAGQASGQAADLGRVLERPYDEQPEHQDLAARRGKKRVEMVDIDDARDKVLWGRERRRVMDDAEKRLVAWHEAGHALVNVVLQHTHPLHKVTIIPRGQALGATMYLPKDDVLNRRRKEMLDTIAVTMAGRIAEEIVSGDITTGAAGDIQQATSLARAMVCQWGMSDKLGMVQYGNDDEFVFLGRDMTRTKAYSELAAREIDAEVRRLISTAERSCRELLKHLYKLLVFLVVVIDIDLHPCR